MRWFQGRRPFLSLRRAALLGLLAARAWAADPQPYEVTLRPSGDAELDRAARDSATLTLRDKAPVGGFALVQRAITDSGRFQDALRAFGYHDGTVTVTIAGWPIDDPTLPAAIDELPASPPAPVVVTLTPGPRFHLGLITIEGDAPPSARAALALREGQEARAADVLLARERLLTATREAGYPFARVELPPAVVYRDQQRLDVIFQVEAGRRAAYGRIEFRGLRSMNEAFMRRRLKLRPGETFSPTRIEEARRDLASLEVFSVVRVVPGDALAPDGTLPLTIDLTERPLRAVDLGVAWSTDLGFTLNLGWRHRNLFGQAEQLNLTAVTQSGSRGVNRPGYQIGAQFLKPDFLVQDQVLDISVTALKQSLWAYDQEGLIERAGITRKLSPRWAVSAGLLGEQERITQGGTRRNYYLIGLPVSLKYDSTNALLDPTRGGRAALSVTPARSLTGGGSFYTLIQVSGSVYFDLEGEGRGVLALRGLAGQASGVGVFGLPPDQRFYAGGNATVRGYRYQSIGPRFSNGRPTGGTAVSAGSVEFRQRFLGNYGVVAFLDAGQISTTGAPFTGNWRAGAGVGARYYTPIGPIRLDVAVPLNRQSGGDAFEVYIGIGQAF